MEQGAAGKYNMSALGSRIVTNLGTKVLSQQIPPLEFNAIKGRQAHMCASVQHVNLQKRLPVC